MKKFNVTGLCMPEEDYMADISQKLEKISGLVSDRQYFVINRARQYGKTTVLASDEELQKNWTCAGVMEAVKIILDEDNVLFDDLTKNLENHTGLYDFLYSVLIVGEQISFNGDNPVIKLGEMFGYVKKESRGGKVTVSNRLFEIRISNYFISKDSTSKNPGMKSAGVLYQDVVRNNIFDMELCIRKFAEHYEEIFAPGDSPFLERHGRLLFLSYLKPLINGRGFYHIESQFTDLRRMDIVIDYGADQFIVELKLWRGEISHEKAYEQLLDYMNYKNAAKGYLLTFDFRKGGNKKKYAEWKQIGGKRIYDVVV